MAKSFAFLLNVNDIVGARTRTLITSPKHILRKASKREIDLIREVISSYCPHLPFTPEFFYEKESISGKLVKLPESQWKYHVVQFEGDKTHISRLEHAMSLCKNSIVFCFEYLDIDSSRCFSMHQPVLSSAFCDLSILPKMFTRVDEFDVDQIRFVYNLLLRYDKNRYDTSFQFSQFRTLLGFLKASPFGFLGYFGIIESLVTHQPYSSDPYSSITRQVKSKCTLLNKRFTHPVDYNSYFGDLKIEKIWQKLYSLRSCIAHGDKPDFRSKTLVQLRNFDNAFTFILEYTKKLIIQSLIEPELMESLKNC